MKKIILLSTAFFCLLQLSIFSIQAQILYGTTSNGGNERTGTINKFIPATNQLIIAKTFAGLSNPRNPDYTNFIQASDGKLYGMTYGGGANGYGTIFSLDTFSTVYTKLVDFDNTDGAGPHGSLMQASDGKLYGMTAEGGSNGYGVIFCFDPVSSTYTKLKDFDGINGAGPFGSLVEADNGKLYGMTAIGGSSDLGVIFSFDPSSSTYSKLKDFNGTTGALPYGSLIQASDGKLYGMTQYGGSSYQPAVNYGAGVIFSFDPSSSTYTKLKDFDGTNGGSPTGSLMQASDGKLYGMTPGVIFSFDASSSTYTKLMDFFLNDGFNAFGSLIQANDGKLYGMTYSGGSSYKHDENDGDGVIFSFDPSSSTYTKLKDFDEETTGFHPHGTLMQANDGKIYGMTSQGTEGVPDRGVIFSIHPSSLTYTVLNNFSRSINEDGVSSGNLLQASDGKLYGMTSDGGNSGHGVIFSFDPSSSTYTKLKEFDDINGSNPHGSLIQAGDGKLYGMTSRGGNNHRTGESEGLGVIFSFDPSSSTYTKLMDFDGINGSNPFGSFIQASDGKLYGMTGEGGSSYGEYIGDGVIFSFDPSSSTYTKLVDFDGINGGTPMGSLTQASDGKLYGMTFHGGSSEYGVIFSYAPSSSTYTKLKDFNYDDGTQPNGSLMQAKDGKLYGMTGDGGSSGGFSGYGVIFSFDPSSSIYTKLKDFDLINGSNPYGSLVQASDGNLYGMTTSGGGNNYGVIFSFDPSVSTYTKLKDFDGINGANPGIGSAFIEVNESVIDTPPTVSLTSPANNTTYTAYGYTKIILNANASDADGTISKVEFYNGTTLLQAEYVAPYGFIWHSIAAGNYTITAKATDNDGNITTSDAVHISVKPDKAPTVNITSPANGAGYRAYSNIILSADANDVDGTVKKVDFYNGSTLIFTETVAPFKRGGYRLPLGNYSITAKATDNNGRVTTSQPVAISVVANVAPMVSITSPANHTTYVSPATIILSADASDVDGTIKKVDFYNGSTLLFTENDAPYFRSWPDVPDGNYSITAIATDNEGKITTSIPVAISVIAASRSLVKEDKLNSSKEPLSLNLNPNPVANILNISVHGLQTNNRSTISVLSVSGAVIKIIQPGALSKKIQLDVSSLSGGVYFIKVINGDKIIYKQFVKL